MRKLGLFRHSEYVLDASSAINLCATGYIEDIVHTVPVRIAISTYVKNHEAIGILKLRDCNGIQRLAPIDLDRLIASGDLRLVYSQTRSIANTAIVLSAAGIRGMGEKISAAIALERGWGLVLDDKHATVKLAPQMPKVQMLTTLDLVKFWSEKQRLRNGLVREVLVNIRTRGNYIIPKDHRLYVWATSHVDPT